MQRVLVSVLCVALLCGFTIQAAAEDDASKVKRLLKQAKRGDTGSQVDLGFMYSMGKGVKQDYEKALKWYRKAADQGFAKAQYYLATKYENGVGVARNLEEAVRWYRLAAEQGRNDAKKALARLGR